jgi:hypothetical protein
MARIDKNSDAHLHLDSTRSLQPREIPLIAPFHLGCDPVSVPNELPVATSVLFLLKSSCFAGNITPPQSRCWPRTTSSMQGMLSRLLQDELNITFVLFPSSPAKNYYLLFPTLRASAPKAGNLLLPLYLPFHLLISTTFCRKNPSISTEWPG